jgi:mono/diheme cytochrome c family protein
MFRTLFAALFFLLSALQAADDNAAAAQQILKKNCLLCHGAAMQSSGLDLRTRDAMIKGGERGPSLKPGDALNSKLYRFASAMDQPSMPPGKKLNDADLAVLKTWIESGARFEAIEAPKEEDPQATLAKLEERPITEEERKFWSFQPVKRSDPPANGHANPIDAFLNAAWKSKGLTVSPPAAKRTLIRRAYLDVIGIPPTIAQVNAFLADNSPDAFNRVVETLLASPHYGERWGRHWLDLARYADSAGYEFDRDRFNVFRYRDWVVNAFNQDMPYSRFLQMQLAGDEYEPGTAEAKIATGFVYLGPEANQANEQTRMDALDDILSTTGTTMLGMTIGCARCHNHKFDPIPQKDYYRMQAVFFPSSTRDLPIVAETEMKKYEAARKAWKQRLDAAEAELKALQAPYRAKIRAEKIAELPDFYQLALKTPPEKRTEGQRLNAEQVEKTLGVSRGEIEWILSPEDDAKHCKLTGKIALILNEKPEVDTAFSTVEAKGGAPEPSHFLHHGSIGNKGTVMKPGVLTVASAKEPDFPTPDPNASSSLRRRTFAEWVTSPQNPLTARVMVNRIWQHHFGEGIVRTPSNFGKTGERPTNPELLDWLASEFVAKGWSMKAMHRLMLTSDAYQMASDDIAANRAIDPDNRLHWRQARIRVEAEILRDQVLATAGTLDLTMGGPGVYPYIDPALFASSSRRTWPGKPEEDPSTYRRSLYVFSKRTIPLPMFELFDKPDTNIACSRRNRSTIATQSLILMNSGFAMHQAKLFAARVTREAGNDKNAQIARAYEIALNRPPTAKEVDLALSFLSNNPTGLVDLCQTIFNLNEFAYIL